MRTLVIGYGNDSRNDDGIGWYVVAELAKRALPEVMLETAHQLEVEFVETVRDYDRVVFVDAAVPESLTPWSSEDVRPGFQSHAIAHYLTPADLLGLCRTLYGHAPSGVLVSIRGHDFNFGAVFSEETQLAAQAVIEHIVALVTQPELETA